MTERGKNSNPFLILNDISEKQNLSVKILSLGNFPFKFMEDKSRNSHPPNPERSVFEVIPKEKPNKREEPPSLKVGQTLNIRSRINISNNQNKEHLLASSPQTLKVNNMHKNICSLESEPENENNEIYGDLCYFSQKPQKYVIHNYFIKRMKERMQKWSTNQHLVMILNFLKILNNLFLIIVVSLHAGFEQNFIGELVKIPMICSFCGLVIEFIVDFFKEFEQNKQINTFLKFLKDFLSVFYAIIAFSGFQNELLVRTISFFCFFRFVNLQKAMRYFEKNPFFNSTFCIIIAFVFLSVKILLFTHIYSCFWHFIGFSVEDSWIGASGLIKASWNQRYIESFRFISSYFNHNNWTSINPTNNLEKTFAIFASFSSPFLFLYLLISSFLILQQTIHSSLEKRKFYYSMRDFQHSQSEFPENLLKSIKNQIKQAQNSRNSSYTHFMNNLSSNLKSSLLWQINHPILNKAFQNQFSEATLHKFANEMIEIHVLQNEILFPVENETNPMLYIVKSGNMELFLDNQTKVLKKLGSGSFFPEESLYSQSPHANLRVKAITPSRLLMISKVEFIRILKEHPEDYEAFCQQREKMLTMKDIDRLININSQLCMKNPKTYTVDCPSLKFRIEHFQSLKETYASHYQPRTYFQRKIHKSYNALVVKKTIGSSLENCKFEDENNKIESRKTLEDDPFEDSAEYTQKNLSFLKRIDSEERISFNRKLNDDFEAEFEKARNFQVFFPHNNADNVIQEINEKRKKVQKQFFTKNSLVSFESVVKKSGESHVGRSKDRMKENGIREFDDGME